MSKVQGNRHVQRVVAAMHSSRPTSSSPSSFPLQAKLTVNAPDDQYEQEADQVAAQVMRMPAAATPPPDDAEQPPSIQTLRVQRADGEAGVGAVAPEVENRVAGLQGGGSPLPDGERQFFEERMGQDFSQVRLHTDGPAAQLSQDLSARAFTVGNDIAFNEGEYQPGSSASRELLAHELTHTIQQTGGQAVQAKVQRAPDEESAEEAPAPEAAVQQAAAELTPADAEKEAVEPIEGEPAALTADGAAPAGSGGAEGGAVAVTEASPAPASKEAETPAGPAEAGAGSAPQSAPAPTVTPVEAKAAEGKPAEAAKAETGTPAAQVTTEAESAAPASAEASPNAAQAPVSQAATQEAAPAPTLEANASPHVAEAAQTTPPSTPMVAQEEETPTVQRQVLPGLLQRTPAPKSAEADPAFQAVVGKVKGSATAEKEHAPAQQKADEAAAAAKMPEEEKKGKAQDQQATTIAAEASAQEAKTKDGEAPGFDKAGFVSKVKARIDELTPSDPKEMEEGGGSVFDNAKGAMDEQVEAGKETAQGNVDDKVEEEPNTSAVAEKAVTALPGNNPGTVQGAGDATGAAPKEKGAEEVERPIQQESQALDQQMADAQVTEEQLQKSNEPSFQQAMEAKAGAQTHAEEGPKNYRSGEQGQIGQAQGQAQVSAEAGTLGMHDVRGLVFGDMDTLQEGAKTDDEAKRAEIGKEIDTLYQSTKTEVEGLLTQMEEAVQSKFNAGADAAKSAAVDWIKAETKKYKDERYNADAEWYDVGSHIEGGGKWLWDNATDMPEEYYEIYRQGRDKYTEQMETVLNEVADVVGDYLGRAKTRIEEGKQQIAAYVAKQPEELRQVAQEAADDALGKFDELEQTVDAKQDELINSLAEQYNAKLAELDAELEKMKEEDKGLMAKAKDAIGGVIETIQELKAMLEGVLARAAGAVMKILEDPIGFLSNLLDAVKGGLNQFVANIGTHLQTGLLSWLTGTIASSGLQMPAQLDLPGIFSLVMQVLGLTWENIRGQIVRALGPQGEMIVGALETGWEVLQIIQSEGLAGLWRVVQEQIGDLKAMVLDEIKQMVIGEVIEAGIQWVIGILGGPAGAFIKAAQAIIKVVTWFIENGSRLMSLVNSVLNSVSAIANGDIGGAANFIEQSLAQAIPTAISFLANLLGLGDIAKKVQGIIEKVKEPINKAIAWLVQQAKALGKKVLGKLGIGKKKPGEDGADERSQEDKQKALDEGLAAAYQVMGRPGATPDSVRESLPGIKAKHGLVSLTLEKADKNGYYVEGKVNPEGKSPVHKLGGLEFSDEEILQMTRRIAERIFNDPRTIEGSQQIRESERQRRQLKQSGKDRLASHQEEQGTHEGFVPDEADKYRSPTLSTDLPEVAPFAARSRYHRERQRRAPFAPEEVNVGDTRVVGSTGWEGATYVKEGGEYQDIAAKFEVDFIAKLQVMYGSEGERNPVSLVTAPAINKLLQSGQMQWDELPTLYPMATDGAVAAADRVNIEQGYSQFALNANRSIPNVGTKDHAAMEQAKRAEVDTIVRLVASEAKGRMFETKDELEAFLEAEVRAQHGLT